MISFNCIVQEGSIPPRLRPQLRSGLARLSTSLLGGTPAEVAVEFTEIPRGFGFRGGEISTTSMVRGLIPPGCVPEVRVDLMQQICDLWCATTGCAVGELIVSARDRG